MGVLVILRGTLMAMINLGEKMGCDMTAEKLEAFTLSIPVMPS